MEAEEVLKLFDYCWFERAIFTSHVHMLVPAKSSDDEKIDESRDSNVHGALNLQLRSLSDRSIGFDAKKYLKEASPSKPKKLLEKILSGKEVEFTKRTEEEEENLGKLHEKKKLSNSKRKKGMRRSRSFSALEFEEVKGFIDLGFTFTEEDKRSSLVSIIPGLQKWGSKTMAKDRNEQREIKGKIEVSRPYLSEAWKDLEIKRKIDVMNLKNISPGNDVQSEIIMKDHLRVWAQTVASTVIR